MTNLYEIVNLLLKSSSLEEKELCVDDYLIQQGISVPHKHQNYLFKCLYVIGQQNLLTSNRLKSFVNLLQCLDETYASIGGLIGYHLRVVMALNAKDNAGEKVKKYTPPDVIDLSQKNDKLLNYVLIGLKNLPNIAELYPLGGAGDRLDLRASLTKEPLPVACLSFLGMSLLERLVCDVQAKEHLYFKVFGKKIIVPIALMTSDQKNNDKYIRQILEKNGYFGRPKDSFRLFKQPEVPVITSQGQWKVKDDGQLVLKPGGHGLIWKLAEENGIFDWFASLGVKKVLVRQINNPIVGLDYVSLAFSGVGFSSGKHFGFAACKRRVGAKEGILSLVSEEKKEPFLTNIEYTKILETQEVLDSEDVAEFPANTNTLFADIAAISKVLKKHTLPGLLVNSKKIIDRTPQGHLETSMQNIADSIPYEQIFVTKSERLKTISATKRKFKEGDLYLETPQGGYQDYLQNKRELMKLCGFNVPQFFHIDLHPSVGPLYSIIQQKLKKGSLDRSSYLKIWLSEVDIDGLCLKGSLSIQGDHPFGASACQLKNVTIANRGIDKRTECDAWSSGLNHLECCSFFLEENSELIVENAHIEGAFTLRVPSNFRYIVFGSEDDLKICKEEIIKPSFSWQVTEALLLNKTEKEVRICV